MHQPALARPLRRGPACIEPVGGRDREQADVAAVFRHQADSFDGFRRDRAGVGNHDLAIGPRLALPIGAVDDLLAQLGRHFALHLFDRTCRKPQIDRAAGLVAKPVALGRCSIGVLLHIGKGPGHDDGQFVDVGRLKAGEAVLRHADQGLGNRLMRATFARERNAGRRCDQHEARVLIAGIIQCIEAARDEGIVKRADRQQTLAVDAVRQAKRRQQDKQIHLGDAEFDMLALAARIPN